jgi:inner membrane protein
MVTIPQEMVSNGDHTGALMPTILTHAAVPLAIGLGLGEKRVSRRLLVAGVVASMLPDVDTIGFHFGVPYGSRFGHRGFTHSLAFAAVMATAAALSSKGLRTTVGKAFAFVFVAGASHGLLDTLTTGGRGVALLWPFTAQRFFAPWRVIRVSPIGVERFVHGSVWVPMRVIYLVLRLGRSARGL